MLGLALPELDAAVDEHLPGVVQRMLFGGGASEARQLLSSIASGLITTVSLTFSLTVVVFQLASSQYSPRLLRLFPRDNVIRVTLGVLAGTFVYSLTVLRSVREDGVPRFSVTFAYLLTAVGVVLLVVFLGHVVTELRVETMLRRVHREHDRVVAEVLGDDDRAALGTPPALADDAHTVAATSSGFLVAVDEADLVTAAARAGVAVHLLRTVGEHVTAGTPLARYAAPVGSDARGRDRFESAVCDAVVIGYERTSAQDVGFGLQQLVDVCAKALSAGINDPTTARNALGHIGAVLVDLSRRELAPRCLRDPDDVVRVVVPTPTFRQLLEVAFGPVRIFGPGDLVVVEGAFDALRDIGWCATGADHAAAVAEHRDRMLLAARRGLEGDPADVAAAEVAAERVTSALAGRWR